MRYKEELAIIEQNLSRQLGRLYDSIKYDMSLQPRGGRISWQDIQRIYRRRIDDSIRSAVTEMYTLASKKTVERDLRVPSHFLTNTDMDKIRFLSQRYSSWFQIGLEREIVKQIANAYDPVTLRKLGLPEQIKFKDTFLQRMVNSIQSEVTSNAVITKTRQILPETTTVRHLRSAALDDSGVIISGPHFRWKTFVDTAVCEQCASLDETEYAIDDPNIPVPIEATHPACRCELELVDAEFAGQQLYEGIEDIEGITF